MREPRNKKKTNNSWLNFLDTVTTIVIIPILVISIICSVIMINAKRSNNVPNIFGYSLVTILSSSMVNSGFEIDDAVMVKNTDPKKIEVGDIIAYYKYIEPTNKNLSEISQAGLTANAQNDQSSVIPEKSQISSWKLYLSKLFSNITYTNTEASEKAIKANSSIIFHQVVDIVEYDGYKWFRTWGTSNLDVHGDPVYDSYWIREDYIIGRYTHTSSTVRSFLAFASTNTGILWMVEVPSGVHLVLSTLELVEILDMMTKERHERIKNGTYIDRREYKRMLRAKRKLLASGNIDVESFKKMYPSYSNYEIVYSEDENNKQNVNINGPPERDGVEDNEAMLYGKRAGSGGEDESPPNTPRDGPPRDVGGSLAGANGRDGPPGDTGESPPKPRGDTGGSPPENKVFDSRGDPEKNRPPKVGETEIDDDSGGMKRPPDRGKNNTRGEPSESPPNTDLASATNSSDPKTQAKVDKTVYAVTHDGLYDHEDKDQVKKDLEMVSSSAVSVNAKPKKSLGHNEVILTEDELKDMKGIHNSAEVNIISTAEMTNKGVVIKPKKENRFIIVSKKNNKQYEISDVGIVYSVNTGLITTSTGIYKPIITAKGLTLERIMVNSKYTIISAKQDLFGNCFVGVTGGTNTEEVYKTSDGKLVSIWNRNALLTLGDDFKLYFISMEKSFDLNKGVITDLKVMNKEGKLVSATRDNNRFIKFIDGFDKYGFMFLKGNILCLQVGKMLFNLENKVTTILNENEWITKDYNIIKYDKEKSTAIRYALNDYLVYRSDESLSIKNTIIAENVVSVNILDKLLTINQADSKKQIIELLC